MTTKGEPKALPLVVAAEIDVHPFQSKYPLRGDKRVITRLEGIENIVKQLEICLNQQDQVSSGSAVQSRIQNQNYRKREPRAKADAYLAREMP